MRLKNTIFQIGLSFLAHSELVLIFSPCSSAHPRHLSVKYDHMQMFMVRICRKTQNTTLSNSHGNYLQNA